MDKAKQPKPLYEFWKDKPTRENVREYIIQFLKDEAVRMLMNNENVVGISLAKDLVEKSFENMDIIFAKKAIEKNTINQAR